MEDILIAGVIFFAAYQIIKLFSTHLLKRKLIKAEQYERVGILEEPTQSEESNKYPSLKWGLVAFMTGLGFIVIELLRLFDKDWIDGRDAVLPIGILFVFVSLGFLIYFFIMNGKKANM
ncbi:MAG: DUF6249 domain-containing protein [Bacteroidota bacterium]